VIFLAYVAVYVLASSFYVKQRKNYYITVPLYELLGVLSLQKDRDNGEYDWMREYMDIDKVLFRYERSNCLIPVFWAAAGKGEFDMSSVQKDHEKIREDYFDSVRSNFLPHVRIKVRHFLYTLGFGGYNGTPYFSDNLPLSRIKSLVVEDLEEKGLYESREFMHELGYLSETAKSLENSSVRFVLVSALIPLLLIATWLAYFAIHFFKRRFFGNFDISLLGICLITLSYSLSYLIASHGGFSKYQFPVYAIGVILLTIQTFAWVNRIRQI